MVALPQHEPRLLEACWEGDGLCDTARPHSQSRFCHQIVAQPLARELQWPWFAGTGTT